MAKKKKRVDFQAPTNVSKAAAKAKAVGDTATDGAAAALDDGTAAASAAATKAGSKAKAVGSKTTASSTKKASATAGGKSAKGASGRGGTSKQGMSGRTQWMLVGGGIAAIVGAVLVFSFLNAGGGNGVLTVSTWDIPARADDTDNGDEDGRIKMTDFAGTPTVVNFFASWCAECDAELPHFTRLGERYEDQVDMVFVNANEDSGDWRDMMDRHDIVGNFPVAKDIKGTNRNGLLRQLGGNDGMPATAFYDASGRLVKFTRGIVVESRLLDELAGIGVEL